MRKFRKRDIYNALVNRRPGISARYHKLHDGSHGGVRIASWLYLLWLNFACYILQMRFLGKEPATEMYESKRLNCKRSETEEYLLQNRHLRVEHYVEKLSDYDVISFDVFDTLILRAVSQPADVFYFVGNELGIMDFRNIRIWAEQDARIKRNEKEGDMEISLSDIWDNLYKDVGLSSQRGQAVEEIIEKKLCYANPFMLEVWRRLIEKGKKLIVVSDMYLSEKTITHIMENCGYYGAERFYISNEYHKSKATGTLFSEVLTDLYGTKRDAPVRRGRNVLAGRAKVNRNPNGFSIVHVGDNLHSDYDMARRRGLDVMLYQNLNKNVLLYRAFDLSPMVGSAYRAIVSNWLYSGVNTFSMEYEYGYIYGGLFVFGYCTFIHDYCEKHAIDKILFLSRDGDILKQAYDSLYPEERTEYAYWSRKAATKLEAFYDKHDYFRRFVYHKINQNYSIRKVLHSMELDFLTEELGEWSDTHCKNGELKAEAMLTDKNGYLLRQFVEAKWESVLEIYRTQSAAAKSYFENLLSGCRRAVAVDIGWAGSGAMVLRHLISQEWNLPCEIIGVVAGTNTIHNGESDAAESFLQSGKLVSYLYAQSFNRDLLKRHDLQKDYNVFWELLLSSPTPQFQGFYSGDAGGGLTAGEQGEMRYLAERDITLSFGKYDTNRKGMEEIQKGIMDFVMQYYKSWRDFPYMFCVSGRDAYAPMLVAASHNEKYLKAIEEKFRLEVNVE